jgi:hypothetical protein
MTTPNPNGRVLYQGPSMLDGAPIVVIATGFAEQSANDKTGAMLQTWILRADIPPHHAFKSAAGRSVCGDCPHGGTENATCYVSWYRAPLAVWNCWHHGAGYAPATPADFDGAMLRLGSAGDPAAVPPWVWQAILPRVAGRTGYTHQWRRPVGSWLRGIVQASCDSMQDLHDARAAGWRTFTVTPLDAPDPTGTVHCAASTERGNKTNCARCSLCDGASADVVIHAHGVGKSRVTWQPIHEQVNP